MFLMTLGNIGDLWDAIHETDLVVIGKGSTSQIETSKATSKISDFAFSVFGSL